MPYCQLYKLLKTCWLKLLLFRFQEGDHYVLAIKARHLAQPSKKQSCPAQLKLWELVAFPDYKVILNKENNNNI